MNTDTTGRDCPQFPIEIPEDEAPDTFERLDSVLNRVLASLKPIAGNDDRTK